MYRNINTLYTAIHSELRREFRPVSSPVALVEAKVNDTGSLNYYLRSNT
jgi:hypothetical protein